MRILFIRLENNIDFPGQSFYCLVNMDEVIRNLKSKSISNTYNALLNIRTNMVKDGLRMEYLQKRGLIPLLISFIEHPKLCNIALSILATCSLRSNFRREIIEKGGVACLIRILKGLANDEIINRVCRALGNISLSYTGAAEVNKHAVIEPLVQLLNSSTDENCLQSVIRTVRILGEDATQRKMIIRLNGILFLANLLSSTNEQVLLASIKALACLTRSCHANCALQLQKANALPTLVKLYHSFSKENQKYALIVLENLACFSPMVGELSDLKVLKIFIDEAKRTGDFVKEKQSAALSLSLCCKHSLNRQDVRDMGGLEVLINILKDRQLVGIHAEIMPAVVLLCSDINDLQQFQELNLLPICIKLLEEYVELNKKDHGLIKMKPSKVKKVEEAKKTENNLIEASTSKKSNSADVVVAQSMPSTSGETVFSIHSPTYQGLQLSGSPVYGAYSTFTSPVTSVSNNFSPEYSYEWNPSSPLSCGSPLGPWSPGSSNNDYTEMCWSPVMSSRSNTPDSMPEAEDDVDDSKSVEPDICEQEPTEIPASSSSSSHDVLQIQDQGSREEPVAIPGPSTIETSVPKRKFSDCNSESEESNVNESLSDIEIQAFKSMSKAQNTESNVSGVPLCSKGIDHYILTLLSFLAYKFERTSNSEVLEEGNVKVLMDYVALVPAPNQKASKILYSLISNRYSFEKLVTSNFVGLIDSCMETPHYSDDCRRCQRLVNTKNKLMLMGRIIAESDFGVGTLAHILKASKLNSSKVNCLYAIGKLVEGKKNLYDLLFKSGGFDILVEFLSEECEDYFMKSAVSLSMICCSAAGKYSRKSKLKTSRQSANNDCKFGENPFDIQFILDDGTQVSASRDKLCTSSDFFNVMLAGPYIEATQNVVSLPSISSEAFLLILHFLHGCSVDDCVYWTHLSTEILLQLLAASERFMLFHLKEIVIQKIISVMEIEDVYNSYEVAIMNNCASFMIKLLQFILCSKRNDDDVFFSSLRKMITLDPSEFFKYLNNFLIERLQK